MQSEIKKKTSMFRNLKLMILGWVCVYKSLYNNKLLSSSETLVVIFIYQLQQLFFDICDTVEGMER